jgi:hypothetical protein
MKRAIAGVLLLVGMGVAPALAYDGGLHRDIRHDERKIARDRHELRRDLRNGNSRSESGSPRALLGSPLV